MQPSFGIPREVQNQNTGNDRRHKNVTGHGPQPSALPPQATGRPLPSQPIYVRPVPVPIIPQVQEVQDPDTKAKRKAGIPTQQFVKASHQPPIYRSPLSRPQHPSASVLLQQPTVVLQQPPVVLQQPRPPIYMPIPVPVNQPATTIHIEPAPRPQTVHYHGRNVTNTPNHCLFSKVMFAALLIIPTILFFTVPAPLTFIVTASAATTLLILAAISSLKCRDHAKWAVA